MGYSKKARVSEIEAGKIILLCTGDKKMDIVYMILLAVAILVALGWIGYGIWWYKVLQEEKKHPNKKTEHLEKVKKSFAEYAKKVGEYKLKPYERKEDDKKAIR